MAVLRGEWSASLWHEKEDNAAEDHGVFTRFICERCHFANQLLFRSAAPFSTASPASFWSEVAFFQLDMFDGGAGFCFPRLLNIRSELSSCDFELCACSSKLQLTSNAELHVSSS